VVPNSVNSIARSAALLPSQRGTAVEVQHGRRAWLSDEHFDESRPGQRLLVDELHRGEQRRDEDLLGTGPAAQEHVLGLRRVRHGGEVRCILRTGGRRRGVSGGDLGSGSRSGARGGSGELPRS
jgi:hypothetical protein